MAIAQLLAWQGGETMFGIAPPKKKKRGKKGKGGKGGGKGKGKGQVGDELAACSGVHLLV